MMHLPENDIRGTSQLKQSKAGSGQAPLDLNKIGISLGKNIHRNVETEIFMSPEDRLRHFYVIGQTGTGKTTLLKRMIRQDILNGDGVCMIDPHGSDIQDVLSYIPKERLDDLVYFDPSQTDRPMGLNMLEYDIRFPEQKTFVVNEMLSIFNKLFDMKVAGGPMFEQYFRNSVMLVLDDPESGNTLLDVSRVLSNKQFRDLKISKCKNPLVIQFWKEIAEKAGGEASLANIVPYIVSKFDVFLQNDIMRPIIAQEKSSFNFREIMDNKKILLVNLSKGRLGDINANLLGLIIVGKILMAALSRVDSLGKDLPPFYLYIDEFQNITTDSISTIFSEARKYKLSLTVAHQFIAQLEEKIRDSVFGNVGSIASFRVSSEDAEYLEKQFTPVFSAKDLMNVDNLNCYIKMLSAGRPVKPFSLFVPFPPRGESSLIDKIKELSYLKYGRDKNLVEAEIMKKYEKKEAPPPPPIAPFKI
jgi:GTPase SAR1 family protein